MRIFLICFLLLPSLAFGAWPADEDPLQCGSMSAWQSITGNEAFTIFGTSPYTSDIGADANDLRYSYWQTKTLITDFNRYYEVRFARFWQGGSTTYIYDKRFLDVPVGDTCADIVQEPSECNDGTPNNGETGIDCGGSCAAPDDVCSEFCPEGWSNIAGTCYSPEVAMIAGLCPEGTTIENLTDQTCVRSQLALSANYDYSEVIDGSEPEWVFNDENSEWVSDTTYNSVDNGDGTSTETTVQTETATNPDGTTSTSTTTTTTIINNTTGKPISSTVSADSVDESVIGNLFGSVPTGNYDGDISADLPGKSSINTLIDGFIETSPLFGAFDTFEVQTEGAVCAIDLGEVYGKVITMDVCQWEDDLSTFGLLFLSIVQAYSLLVVYRGWK